jgi:hypothetical protein
LRDEHARLPFEALDFFDLSANRRRRHLVGGVDGVPHRHLVVVLRHHDVAAGHPRDKGAIRQQRAALLRRDVDEVQAAPVVAEEQ